MMDVDINQKITLDNFRDELPNELADLVDQRDGPALLVQELPKHFSPESVSPKEGDPKTREQLLWELVGSYYRTHNRPHEAIPIYSSLYNHMLEGQDVIGARVHKGMPLVWISDCYRLIGFRDLAKRYIMLTLCEDAIIFKGDVDPNNSGTYFRLVWIFGMPDSELRRYSEEIFQMYQSSPKKCWFPEWALQEIDQDWKNEIPALQESGTYVANRRFITHLISQLGDGTGKAMERLADYLLSCLPGCKTTLRKRSSTTEYDLVCSIQGLDVDFLSEIGRYFVCECKDRGEPAGFPVIAKFCRVLDSTKSNFGVLFSKRGISGKGKTLYAERERIKIYQDRGISIVVIDLDDLKLLAEGGNLQSLLRSKYESLRLDLLDTPSKEKSN